MKLINELVLALPPLYSTEDIPAVDKIIGVKFFYPYGAPTWLAVEYSPEENICYGYCDLYGHGPSGGAEWGYFSLNELEEARCERDNWFTPRRFGDCISDEGLIRV